MKKLGKRATTSLSKNYSGAYCSCSGHGMYYLWGVRLENDING